MFWHDGSCISNHSHFLVVASTLYDKGNHLTNDKYENLYGRKVDVQGIIEAPEVYILARCPSDNHQLMYSDTRNDDIRHLNHSITLGEYKLQDTVRFFRGDGPACEIEFGQQKNGRYPCWLCPADFNGNVNKLEYLHSLPHLEIRDRCKKILAKYLREELNSIPIYENRKLLTNYMKGELYFQLTKGKHDWNKNCQKKCMECNDFHH